MNVIKVDCSYGLLFGGNANNRANAGFVYANSNNTPSNTSTNIRSHLCLYKRVIALPLGKKFQIILKSVGRKQFFPKALIKKSKAQ